MIRRLVSFLMIAGLIVAILSPFQVAPTAAAPGDRVKPGGPPPPGSGPQTVPYARVIDGNTLEVDIGGHRAGIGLIDVDAPQGNTDCGRAASALLQSLVQGGVRFEEDPDQALAFDKKNRRMYHAITPEGRDVASTLIQAGTARPKGEGKGSSRQQHNADETNARGAGRGCLWNGGKSSASGSDPAAVTQSPSDPTLLALAAALPSGFYEQTVTAIPDGVTTAFSFLPDGRILLAQKSGLVRIYKGGALLPTPFLDIRARVNDYWDRGLLGITIDPNFATNGYVYLIYTYENDPAQYDGTKTSQVLRVTAAGDTAVAGSNRVILGTQVGASCNGLPANSDCLPADAPSHSVGNLRFGPDGTLFVTNGDAGSFNLVNDDALRAQNIDSLSGKILRVSATGAGLAANPFWNGDATANRSKVWAYGVRNAFRFNLRPGTDIPYVGDVGWDNWEEINVASRGANLGWPCYEGDAIQDGYASKAVCQTLYGRGPGAVKLPLVKWGHETGSAAATGGVFYSGTNYPLQYQGAYFYGDYSQGFLRSLRVDSANALVGGSVANFATNADGPVQIEMGPDGDLYYLAINSGELRRIRYGEAPPPPTVGAGYLSDQSWVSATNGWGPVEKDRSNGEDAGGDGRPLTLNGVAYAKGLGVHGASEVRYNLAGAGCTAFAAQVGVDDEVGAQGSVVFQVFADGVKLFDSGAMTGATATKAASVSVAGKGELRLVVTDGGDGNPYDHADWADAKLTCGSGSIPADSAAHGVEPRSGRASVVGVDGDLEVVIRLAAWWSRRTA